MMRLISTMGQASLLFMLTYAAITVASGRVLSASSSGIVTDTLLASLLIVPNIVAFWWIVARLTPAYSRTPAIGFARIFVASSPISLGIGLLLGPTSGGYVAHLLHAESGAVALAGATAEIVVMVAFTAIVPSALVLTLSRKR